MHLSDIDECHNPNIDCDQLCVDTEGSYDCVCRRGFISENDSRNCEGL